MQSGRLMAVAEQFVEPGQEIREVLPYGSGNINDTYRVTFAEGGDQCFILQRLNRRVFPEPERIMANLQVLIQHVESRLPPIRFPAGQRWQLPRVLPARTGSNHWLETDGSFWRALSFIAGARSYRTVQDSRHAKQVGYALGMLHQLMSDLDPNLLADTLPGFHVTPLHLRRFDAVLATADVRSSPDIRYALRWVARYRHRANVLEDATAQGRLHLRPIHGDPKVDNVMLDRVSGRAVAMVDLDTVKPGLIQTDLGDCLRSGCNPAGEDAPDLSAVHFDLDLAEAMLSGYLDPTRHFLSASDRAFFFDAILLLPFELGLRFLTDHLAGDLYFKVKHRGQNLHRAMVQFQLAASIEDQEAAIRTLLRGLS